MIIKTNGGSIERREMKKSISGAHFFSFAVGSYARWNEIVEAKMIHAEFGEGKIIRIRPMGDNPLQIIVDFGGEIVKIEASHAYFSNQVVSIDVEQELWQKINEHWFLKEREIQECKKQQELREIEKRRWEVIRDISMYYRTIQPNHWMSRRALSLFHTPHYQDNDLNKAILVLKNTNNDKSIRDLSDACAKITSILRRDLLHVQQLLGHELTTVVVVPRSKKEDFYHSGQKLFRKTVHQVAAGLEGFEDGTRYIVRVRNTCTTHLKGSAGYVDNDPEPYPGILEDTCVISELIKGKDVLLVDDVYTRRSPWKYSPYIDEDAIQAVRNHGARSVVLYTLTGAVTKPHNKLNCLTRWELDELFR